MSVDGILNVDKPFGITSMDVVRRIKRASGVKRVGHGGTLDPAGTGVIPICLGQATRMMQYLIDGTKEYRAVVELGVTTDTYDAMGQVTDRRDPSSVSLADVERALEGFKGVIQQVPPMYSALKQGGKRLYDLARAGIEVERQPRTIEVFDIQLLEWSRPLVTVEIRCGRGYYMRSFAFDLGNVLGCGGHLKSLIRLRSGAFRISDAAPLSEAEERFVDGTWRETLHAPDVVLYNLRAIIAGRNVEDRIMHGRPLPAELRIPHAQPGERCRAYSVDGRFLAILAFDASAAQWQPDKVFAGSGNGNSRP